MVYAVGNLSKRPPHLEIHHSRPRSIAVPDRGLLEESVDLQQLFIGESLVDLVADQVHSSLEIVF